MNKQTNKRNKLTDTENKLMAARWKGYRDERKR